VLASRAERERKVEGEWSLSSTRRDGYHRFGLSPQSPAHSPCASLASPPYCYFHAMDAQQDPPNVSNVQFRILVIGKANAGKTSILQRVCDTTDSPEIYSVDSSGSRNRVCSCS
jgi:hypothetical protein